MLPPGCGSPSGAIVTSEPNGGAVPSVLPPSLLLSLELPHALATSANRQAMVTTTIEADRRAPRC